jgi:hypothetical protein
VGEKERGHVMKILSISLPFFDKGRQPYAAMCMAVGVYFPTYGLTKFLASIT